MPNLPQEHITPKFTTFGENLLWAYSSLQMVGCMQERKKSDEIDGVSEFIRNFAAPKKGTQAHIACCLARGTKGPLLLS